MAKGLSIETIVQAGFEVLGETGLDGMTMRIIAARLGVKAAAIYWHLKSKQDLLDEMATQQWREIIGEIAGFPESTTSAEGLAAFAHIVRATLLKYRDGARLFAGTFLTDSSLLAEQREQMSWMIDAGYTVKALIQAYALIYNFTVGFTIEEQAIRQAADDRYSLETRAERLGPDVDPIVLAAGVEVFSDSGQRFEELIALLVQTAESLRS